MLWLKQSWVGRGQAWARCTGSEGVARHRENAEPQQEKAFSASNWRAAESCECQQGGAAHLPQGHSGGLAFLGMLGRKVPVFTPCVYLPLP